MINKGHTFSDGDEVTAAKLNNLVDNATITAGTVNPNVLDSSQPVNASAYNVGGTTVIDSSRNIQNAADVSASSFSVGATQVIDSSLNITNAGTVNAGSANISGSTQFGGAASSYCYLYADTVNLGEDSGSTVNLKGVLTVGASDPAPSIPAATLVKANDAFLGFSNSAGNKLRKFNLTGLQAAVGKSQETGSFPAETSKTEIPHNLSGVPHSVRVVAVCDTADQNWSAGDEVNIECLTDGSGQHALAVKVDGTNVTVYRANGVSTVSFTTLDGAGDPSSTGAMNTANWSLKAYCVYFP